MQRNRFAQTTRKKRNVVDWSEENGTNDRLWASEKDSMTPKWNVGAQP